MLGNLLHVTVSSNSKALDECLPYVEFAYNRHQHRAWSGGKIVLGYKSSSTKKTKKKGRRMMNNNKDMKNKNNKYKGTRNLNDKYLRIR